jgi:hypothetical protein
VIEAVAPLAPREDGERLVRSRLATDHVADGLPTRAACWEAGPSAHLAEELPLLVADLLENDVAAVPGRGHTVILARRPCISPALYIAAGGLEPPTFGSRVQSTLGVAERVLQ